MNKQTKAKLINTLDSMSLTQDQRNTLIEAFESSGGSGNNKETVLTFDMDNQKVWFQDVEYDCVVTTEALETSGYIINIANTTLNNVLLDYCKNNNALDLIIIISAGDDTSQCSILTYSLDRNGKYPLFVVYGEGIMLFKFITKD